MTIDATTFPPIPTCEIPMPIVECPGEGRAEGAILPRILLQAAGTGHAARNVKWLTAVFLAAGLLELALWLRMPTPEPEIVYGDFPRQTLMEAPR
jgi:hypothetical protein